jgi:hypothetical protein
MGNLLPMLVFKFGHGTKYTDRSNMNVATTYLKLASKSARRSTLGDADGLLVSLKNPGCWLIYKI